MSTNLEQRGAGFGVVHADHSMDASPGPYPGCSNFGRCAQELIACERFAAFTRREPRWETRSMFPQASTYREIFRGADVPADGVVGRRSR